MRRAAIILIALLSACGGGDPDDERVDTGPVHCTAKPELCR